MKLSFKTKFGMLALSAFLVYTFWFNIAIGCLHVYAFATDNTHGKRLLGEYYAAKSIDYSVKANIYFKQDLEGYKIKLAKPQTKHKAQIELLIGNQYEFGKGVEPDLEQANSWYKKAIKDCLPQDKLTLDLIYEALNRTKAAKK